MSEEFVNITTAEVARIAHVDASTVRKWAEAGKLPYSKTEGGHYRFNRDLVVARYSPRGAA